MTAGKSDAWADALLAAQLLARDPRLGGVLVRAAPGPVRDRYVAILRARLPKLRRLPAHAGPDSLLGGLDLAATLRSGRPVATRGLLAEADGGVILLAMAERVAPAVAALLATALDGAEIRIERDGLSLSSAAAIGIIALDEGGPEEHVPASLADRLAFHVDLSEVSLRDAPLPTEVPVPAADPPGIAVALPDAMIEALAGVAARLGIPSLRALLLAAGTARAAAALAGRTTVVEADAMVAARLVLAPRATVLPQPAEPPPAPGESAPEPAEADRDRSEGQPSGDMVLEAARAAIPPGLLAALLAGAPRRTATAGGGAEAQARRGRPAGVRPGSLRDGTRLDLVATLRTAAPWQRLRARAPGQAVLVRPDDIRVKKFRQRTGTTAIFAVDASGSTALARLGEAKGAVELVLAECYVRRDEVALIAFRGTEADLLLPPTASLVRAKRCLARLPGGGATPLAAGLLAAGRLAQEVRRRGRTPIVILLSDGRANIARDGSQGRARAEEDALGAGRLLRQAGIGTVVVDTAARPTPQARALATAMGARHLPLPYADAATLARTVVHA